jgi:hypothetical protein
MLAAWSGAVRCSPPPANRSKSERLTLGYSQVRSAPSPAVLPANGRGPVSRPASGGLKRAASATVIRPSFHTCCGRALSDSGLRGWMTADARLLSASSSVDVRDRDNELRGDWPGVPKAWGGQQRVCGGRSPDADAGAIKAAVIRPSPYSGWSWTPLSEIRGRVCGWTVS